jgi:hypothetical protein
LLSVLRQFLKKLALSSGEIRTLPSNYAAARAVAVRECRSRQSQEV